MMEPFEPLTHIHRIKRHDMELAVKAAGRFQRRWATRREGAAASSLAGAAPDDAVDAVEGIALEKTFGRARREVAQFR